MAIKCDKCFHPSLSLKSLKYALNVIKTTKDRTRAELSEKSLKTTNILLLSRLVLFLKFCGREQSLTELAREGVGIETRVCGVGHVV